jgi:hypothetical protein
MGGSFKITSTRRSEQRSQGSWSSRTRSLALPDFGYRQWHVSLTEPVPPILLWL